MKEVVRPETLEIDEFKWFQVAIADIGSKTYPFPGPIAGHGAHAAA